jgi:hypothetical protein
MTPPRSDGPDDGIADPVAGVAPPSRCGGPVAANDESDQEKLILVPAWQASGHRRRTRRTRTA